MYIKIENVVNVKAKMQCVRVEGGAEIPRVVGPLRPAGGVPMDARRIN